MIMEKMFFKLCCILCLIGFLKGTTPQTPECYTQPPGRRVRTCKDRYAVIPDNLFCLRDVQQQLLSPTEEKEIVTKHNEIRSNVTPTAANMLPLSYITGLARTAKIWAELCKLQPSSPLQRFRPGSYEVGENVLVSRKNMNWSEVIDVWANEESKFTFGRGGNDPSLVSNYTQIVWASSSTIGCSKEFCSGQYFYVCHYAPAMKHSSIDNPYESSNQSCTKCKNCTNAMCDCKGITCLNGGEVNFATCLCDCIAQVKTYETPTCELKCDRNGDDLNCGKVYKQSTCNSSFETMYHCPWLCDICPYADKDYNERSEPLPWERNKTECPSPTTTKSGQQGTPASTRSPLITRSSVQGGVTNKPVDLGEENHVKATTSLGGTSTKTQHSESEQMNGRQCDNSSPGTRFSHWAVVFAFILTSFSIVP